MKVTKYLFVLIFFLGCSSIKTPSTFTFYGPHGRMYQSDIASKMVKKAFKLERSPKLVVLATSSSTNQKYIEQSHDISKANAEELGYMFIVANSEEEDQSGYYLKKEDAENYLSGNDFQVVVYDNRGRVITQSNDVISLDDFKAFLADKPPTEK